MRSVFRGLIRFFGISVFCKHGLNRGWVCAECEDDRAGVLQSQRLGQTAWCNE